MAVDFDRFLKWAKSRFPDVIVNGGEVRLPSIFFPDDDGHRLWCSPGGGKKGRPDGVYHCFKTDKKGSLVRLVERVEQCNRDDARSILNGQPSLRELEAEVEAFLNGTNGPPPEVVAPVIPTLQLPPGTNFINDLGGRDWWGQQASAYLAARKLPTDGLAVCREDRYKYRVVIPYYGRDGRLIYFNARHLGKSKAKYLGPPKECGVGKGDVVYIPYGRWPQPDELVYLCEGEFNALSLCLAELPAAACGGKNMTERQALLLSDYRLCLCLDRDTAGRSGTSFMSNAVSMLTQTRAGQKLFYVRPPIGL